MCRSILPVLIAALACVVFTTDAMAIYHPGLGRYMQRDPHGTMLEPPTTRVAGGIHPGGSGFIQRDAIDPQAQYIDGMNLYQYLRSMPTTFVDPNGINVFAIDGTWTDFGDGSNTEAFYRRSLEQNYFWNGPNFAATGLDSHGIRSGVIKQICEDWCQAKEDRETITVNLVGWSRGANIALLVAEKLKNEGCCCCWNMTRRGRRGCNDRVYPTVNFMGLFDAVDMTITPGWVNNAINVSHFAHALEHFA